MDCFPLLGLQSALLTLRLQRSNQMFRLRDVCTSLWLRRYLPNTLIMHGKMDCPPLLDLRSALLTLTSLCLALLGLQPAMLTHRLQRSNQMFRLRDVSHHCGFATIFLPIFLTIKKHLNFEVLYCQKWWWKMDSNHRSR